MGVVPEEMGVTCLNRKNQKVRSFKLENFQKMLKNKLTNYNFVKFLWKYCDFMQISERGIERLSKLKRRI